MCPIYRGKITSVIVHQGGIGTVAQSLNAQRPILVVPFGFDQFDNGERIEELGIGKCILKSKYSVENAAPILEELHNNARYQDQASSIGKMVSSEDTLSRSCDFVEELLYR
ncbi:MAG: nucleotide disphospho-sugar-binding domain-containing protein [Candidatus Thiodiazotropha taylori]